MNFTSDKKEVLRDLREAGGILSGRYGKKPAQNRVLYHVKKNGGEIGQRELQDILRIQQGSLSELLIKMESSGLIERKNCEKDRRRTMIVITQAGSEVERENHKRTLAEDEMIMSVLTDNEWEQLAALMNKLLGSWRQREEQTNLEEEGDRA